ncbi:MAG TPA: arginine deiminase-related protein [Cyclobacteriaceae bacterium]
MSQKQTPETLLMVRPASFGYNAETAASNAFQKLPKENLIAIQKLALEEFENAVRILNNNGIGIIVISDTDSVKPDAIFPNNWISTHVNGLIITYPMLAPNRRIERRGDVIEELKNRFIVKEVWDISDNEKSNRFLEGTGSIVFDHFNQVAYACLSPRTNEELLAELCKKIGYEAIVFHAVDEKNNSIYHTNVMMWVGEMVAAVCLDAVRSEEDQEKILSKLAETNHKIIAISYQQMNAFAGNMFEVKNKKGEAFILMSQTAFQSLLPGQLNEITKYAEPLIIRIDTIETYGGGGIRCMVAGIYLTEKG